jgi:hypothetical protein
MMGSFGFIREKLEIKILILYILRRLPRPIDFETLAELTMCDDGISYFDFTDCVADLIRTEHISVANDLYTITQKGLRNGEVTENSLPYTVRLNAKDSTSLIRAAQMREALIKTDHKVKHDGSCTVRLSMSDGIGDIIKIELFASNEKHAAALEKGFREKAETVYNTIIKAILE